MPASKTRRWKAQTTKKLAWFHRWLGVATCLVFALWFASGAVLLFRPFPSLPHAAQLGVEAPIDLAAVRVSPEQAVVAAGGAEALRLVQRGAAPAYVASTSAGTVAIDARTGMRVRPLSRAAADRVAHRLPGSGASVEAAIDYDQWVVHNRFDPLRPFFRIDAADGAGTRYYLSSQTGELVQRTVAAERAWNWLGAVLHWAYFTPLRSSFTSWDRTVWCLSFVALLVAVAGTILGVVRTMAAQRQRKPALTFFRLKWMRWHHLLGLFASVFILVWIFSGWLSMDHGRLFSRGNATPDQLARYAGRPLSLGLSKVAPFALRRVVGAREIDIAVVGGEPVVTAWDGQGAPHRYSGAGAPMSDEALFRLASRGIVAAWGGGMPRTVATTTFYALAEGWPASAWRVVDAAGVRPDIAVDGADGRLLTVLDGSRKSYAWFYYGLHTFNFPGLAEHQALRDVLVLIPLLLGFAFSITGVVLGYQRLRKSL